MPNSTFAGFFNKNWPVIISSGLALLGIVAFGVFLRWENVAMSVKMSNFVDLLAPLAFTATVIERAVEILISPWRDAEASKLEKNLAATQANSGATSQGAVDAAKVLDDYRGNTQKYAFAVSLLLSVLASISGVRSLELFVDATNFHALHHPQQMLFLSVDVALTSALLSGGADGIHSIVNAITSFFDASAAKTTKAAS